MEVRLESTDGPGRTAEVWVDGTLFVVMDEYSRAGDVPSPGLLSDVKFTYMTEEGLSWDQAIRGNRTGRRLIEQVRGWRYVGYGRVVQIMPVAIDFGLLTMEDANWTNDEDLIGRFVRVPIDRLSITRRIEDDARGEPRR
ncbi:MAG: hypothetical protein WBF17_20420 [Phycisphaerae bacterium]